MIIGPHAFGFVFRPDEDGTPYSSYKDVILNDNPVGYWKLDDASGSSTAIDETGNSDGNYNGNLSLEEPQLISAGHAVQFNDGTMETGHILSSANGAYSAEVWFNADEVQSRGFILTDRNGNDEDNDWTFQLRVEDGVVKEARGPNIQPSAPVNAGETYHVVVVYNGSEVKLYLNGQLADSASTTKMIDGTSDVGLGNAFSANDDPFQGRIDELALYERELTATEIQNHYDEGVGN